MLPYPVTAILHAAKLPALMLIIFILIIVGKGVYLQEFKKSGYVTTNTLGMLDKDATRALMKHHVSFDPNLYVYQ